MSRASLSKSENDNTRKLIRSWMMTNYCSQTEAAAHFGVSQSFISAFLTCTYGASREVTDKISKLADKPLKRRKAYAKTARKPRNPREQRVCNGIDVDARSGDSSTLRVELSRPERQNVLRVLGEKRGGSSQLLPKVEALDRDCRLGKSALAELERKNKARRDIGLRELAVSVKRCPCCRRHFETAENGMCNKCRKESDYPFIW